MGPGGVGSAAARRGDHATALVELGRACALFADLLAQDGTNVDWRLQLGLCQARRAEALAPGDLGAARRAAREAVGTLGPLLVGEPGDTTRGLVAQAMVRQGLLEEAGGDEDGARRAREAALAALAPCARPMTSWKVLAPWSEAMLALGRGAEAAPAIQLLHRMGYRDAVWLRAAAAADDPPPPTAAPAR